MSTWDIETSIENNWFPPFFFFYLKARENLKVKDLVTLKHLMTKTKCCSQETKHK